jgi:CRP-like cAMP-binding protein
MLHQDPRTRQVVAALQDVALFRELSQAELCALAGQVMRRRYGRHAVLFSQGQRGDGFYIVTDGHAGISQHGPEGDELLLALCGLGEYFGELALFDAALRATSPYLPAWSPLSWRNVCSAWWNAAGRSSQGT